MSTKHTQKENAPRRLRARAAIGCGAVLLAALGATYVHKHVAGRAASATAEENSAFRFSWPSGTRFRYSLTWKGTQTARAFQGGGETKPQDASSKADMALDLVLESRGEKNGATELLASFSGIRRHAFTMLDKDVLDSDAKASELLLGQEALVEIEPDGKVRGVHFRAGDKDVFRNIMQWALVQTHVAIEPGSTAALWTAEEQGPFGKSRVQYARTGLSLTRERLGYDAFQAFAGGRDARKFTTTLEGRSAITLSKDGYVDTIETAERAQVNDRGGDPQLQASLDFQMKLVEVTRGQSSASLDGFEGAVAFGEPVVAASAHAQLLEQRAAGMTAAQVVSDLGSFANGGSMPEHTRWLWRAAAVLEQNPALAAELAKLVRNGGMTSRGIAIVSDLLASVGHAEAQAALREILALPQIRRAPERPLLAQRLSFVKAPKPETADAAWQLYAEGKRDRSADLQSAGAMTVGSTIGNLARSGDKALAESMHKRLRSEMKDASSEERAVLLRALGNAGMPENVEVAKSYMNDEDADVREGAARSLRKVDQADAIDLLVSLVADPDASVGAAALASLGEKTLSEDALGRIAALVVSGRVQPHLVGEVLNLYSKYVGGSEAALAVLRYVAGRSSEDPVIRARVRAMLGRAQG